MRRTTDAKSVNFPKYKAKIFNRCTGRITLNLSNSTVELHDNMEKEMYVHSTYFLTRNVLVIKSLCSFRESTLCTQYKHIFNKHIKMYWEINLHC